MTGLLQFMTVGAILEKAENLVYAENNKDALLAVIEAVKGLRTEIANLRADYWSDLETRDEEALNW